MFTETRDFEQGCRQLAGKLKHYLITMIGRTLEEASARDIYHAISLALREEVMLHWLATWRTYKQKQCKTLFYFSMEYLPGKLTQGVVTNLGAGKSIERVLDMIGRRDCLHHFQERDPALGNGGLGRLASCILESLSTGAYPAIGYGLRYQYGLFEQELWDGQQMERPDWWLEDISPWEFRRDSRGQLVQYFGRLQIGKNIWSEEVGAVKEAQNVLAMPFDIPVVGFRKEGQYNVNTLRLWSTREGPRNFELQRFNAGELDNAAENMTLTDVLYPADHHEVGKRIRLKQEFLLVSASIKDIIRRHKSLYGSCEQLADKVAIQINDTHPALSVAELMHQLTAVEQMPWKKAFEITKATLSYTNHTILKEALEEWSQLQVQTLLPRQYRIIERLNQDFCEEVRRHFKDEEAVRRLSIIQDGRVRMAHLAVVGSHAVNGVAKLHTDILKDKVFKDFHDLYPKKILCVTNGVTPRKWILGANPDLAEFISDRIGQDWITHLEDLKKLEAFAADKASLMRLLEIKKANKEKLINYLNDHLLLRDASGHGEPLKQVLSPNMIFDVQVKRMHEYKRQLLNLLHIISMYQEMLDNPYARLPRLVLFAGKAAASYDRAKNIIHLIASVAKVINADTRLQDRLKVLFVENYNVSLAEKLIPAADLSEQISTAGMEASGTGNMKLALNGALTIGTDDGANVEMRQAVKEEAWPFGFGASCQEIEQLRHQGYHPQLVYETQPKLRRALDSLRDGTFAQTEVQARVFEGLFYSLLGLDGGSGDTYFVLHDFASYEAAQRKVDRLYADPMMWARLSLLNIARMGEFSIDRCVSDYAGQIWSLTSQKIDREVFQDLHNQFNEYVSCPI